MNRPRRFFRSARTPLVIALSLVVAACAGLPAASSGLDGFWYAEAYGYALRIEGRSAALYDVSQAGMVASMRGRISGDAVVLRGVPGLDFSARLASDGYTLVMTAAGTGRFEFRRPADRSDPRFAPIAPTDDPLVNFDVFVATFAERYAFFGVRGVDWAARAAPLRLRAAAASDSKTLFAILSELVAPVDDAHIELYSLSGDEFYPATPIAWLPSAQVFIDAVKAGYIAAPLAKTAGGKLAYGRLRSGEAYLCLVGMEGYAKGGLDAEAAALDAGLDEALAASAGAPSLILDLRFNGGGYDAHALRVAARFTDERAFAYSRRARLGDGWTAEERFCVEPETVRPRWDGPLVVLVSRETTSAAEVLAMCLGELPGVTLVGEATRGAMSDMLYKRLPNGWVYTLSNQEYRARDGLCYEADGYPPDIAAPMDLEAARAGRDPGLEAAMALRESAY